MRRALWAVAAVAGLAWAAPGQSQVVGNTNGDPFFLYYGWFLPQQAAIANQPRVMDTIQQNVANNQVNAQTNRAGLYDPNGGYGRFDPYSSSDLNDRGRTTGGFGMAKSRVGVPTSNANGQGPPLYYNRTAQHYPSMPRSGVHANKNVYAAGRGVRRGASMPSMPSMPGPR